MRTSSILVAVIAATCATQPTFGQAPDLSQLLSGKSSPLSLKLKDLDSSWRVFSVGSSASSNPLMGLMGMGGILGADAFTKGETLTAGGDIFLVIYKPVPPDLSAMMSSPFAPKVPPLTADSSLRLSLLNLHAATELEGIRPFDLKEVLDASKKSSDRLASIGQPTPPSPAPAPDVAPSAAQEIMVLSNGTKAPDFTVHDVKGNAVKLSKFKGKVVVIDFWSTWCGPCQQSLPSTAKVAATYASKGVVVLGVNVWDKKEAFKSWLPQHKNLNAIKFVIDESEQGKDVATSLYKVNGIPTQFILDRKGKIVSSIVGFGGDDSALIAAIKQALKG